MVSRYRKWSNKLNVILSCLFSASANSLASLKGLSGLSGVKRAEFRGNKLTSIDCENCPSLEEIVIVSALYAPEVPSG